MFSFKCREVCKVKIKYRVLLSKVEYIQTLLNELLLCIYSNLNIAYLAYGIQLFDL